jgi:hypothetical protein
VRPVLPLAGPMPAGRPRPLTVGAPMPARGKTARQQLTRQLWSVPGVFLSGATERQARNWARRQAARARARGIDARIQIDGPHRGGRPHLHIVDARDPHNRTGHIFWGRPPTSGTFFESDDR